MNGLARHIAWRYFHAQRRVGAVGVLAAISVVGIGLGTAALIVVLSVFNGFGHLIDGVFAQFDPDIKVVATSGRPFIATDSLVQKLAGQPGVLAITSTLEGRAVLEHHDRRAVITLKGVQENFREVSRVESAIVAGNYELEVQDSLSLGLVLGAGVANRIGVALYDYVDPFLLTTIAQGSNLVAAPEKALRQRSCVATGVFSLQKEYDDQLVVAPLTEVQQLLGTPGQVTALELRLSQPSKAQSQAARLYKLLGPAYRPLTRAEQHQSLYRILQNEKWVGFAVISLILLVASATVIGTLAMIVAHKASEIGTLATLGAAPHFVRKVFLWMGLYVGGMAGMAGLLLGSLLCLLQQTFGLVKIDGGANFLVDAFPVRLHLADFATVGITVLVLALVAASVPAHAAAKARIVENLKA